MCVEAEAIGVEAEAIGVDAEAANAPFPHPWF